MVEREGAPGLGVALGKPHLWPRLVLEVALLLVAVLRPPGVPVSTWIPAPAGAYRLEVEAEYPPR